MKKLSAFLIPIIGALTFIPGPANANSGDFSGAVAIGTGYAGIDVAPTSGLIVQGKVGIGTTSPVNLLDMGNGGGIHITSGVPGSTSMALYNNSGTLTWNGVALATGSSVSGTANYIPYFTSSSSLGNSAIYQSGSNIGIGTTVPDASLDISQHTDALSLPIGTTGQEPASPVVGMIRYNSTNNGFEGYEGSTPTWVSLGTSSGGTGSVINSSGQLLCGGSAPPCHSSTLSYCSYKGNLKTTASYGNYTTPSGTAASGCLTANLSSMYIGGTASQSASASTLYYVYLINVSGTTYLDLETTGHATDSTTGIEIESGNNTRTLVGMIHTDSSKEVATGGTTTIAGDTNTVATWDNRIATSTKCGFTTARSQTSNVGFSEVNSENRCYFMSWGDAAVFTSNQQGSNNTAGSDCASAISLDASGTLLDTTAIVENTAGYQMLLLASISQVTTEGYHFTTLYGNETSGSTCTWNEGAFENIFVYSVQ